MWIGVLVAGGILVSVMAGHALVRKRWVGRLRRFPSVSEDGGELPRDSVAFTYQDLETPELQELRRAHRLDRVAGDGTEFERQIALMRWVHGLSKHAVNPPRPKQVNALHLIRLCQEGKRINCWMFATILTEVYLSMGFPARLVHLLPQTQKPRESHFVTAVYSSQFGKWIMMDPDVQAYGSDEAGAPLGVHEIRGRLVEGKAFRVNRDIDLYCGRLPGRWFRGVIYKTYLAKNLFRYYTPVHSVFDLGSRPGGRVFIEWRPQGYRGVSDDAPRRTRHGDTVLATRSTREFWLAPESSREVAYVLDTSSRS